MLHQMCIYINKNKIEDGYVVSVWFIWTGEQQSDVIQRLFTNAAPSITDAGAVIAMASAILAIQIWCLVTETVGL